METTRFNSRHKAIKMPEGAAAEYAKYSCNFHIGCGNQCTYCFNNRWKWGNVPTLKKCFKDENHALEIFEKELQENLPELQKHGLFFSFTTDTMLPNETIFLTGKAVMRCIYYNVPVKILTKRSDFFSYHNHFTDYIIPANPYENSRKVVAFGFTLTGHDELEPHASANAERIEAMQKLHNAGFKTFASIEPIISFYDSAEMMRQTYRFCDLYKVGLMRDKKYDKWECEKFVDYCCKEFQNTKIYFKNYLLKQAGINREDLPSNCVNRDYNIFNN